MTDDKLDEIILKPAHWQYDDYQKAKQAIHDYATRRVIEELQDWAEPGKDYIYIPVIQARIYELQKTLGGEL